MQRLVNLEGKKGLVVGIANDQSIAYGCAQRFVAAGAELAITYLNEKAEAAVRPLAEHLKSPIIVPCNVRETGQLEVVFTRIERAWGQLDFVLHSIAFAPREALQGRLVDVGADDFAVTLQVSCHSFIRMARLAEPLMQAGGSLLTMGYLGGERVTANYGVMGVAKAALSSSVRYLAADLGKQAIRVNAISPGTIQTRAASGIPHFEELLAESARRTPAPQLATIEDVGALAAFLVSDAARAMTGGIHYVDGGYNIMD